MFFFVLLTNDATSSKLLSFEKGVELYLKFTNQKSYEFKMEDVGSVFDLETNGLLTLQHIPIPGMQLVESVFDSLDQRIGIAA